MKNGYKIAALCTSKIHDEFVGKFISSLNSVLSENGWRLFVYTTDSDLYYKTRSDKGEAMVFDLIDYETTDAVLLFRNHLYDTSVTDSIIRKTNESGVRLVILDDHCDGAISLNFDYSGGFGEVVKHVLDRHGVIDIHMIAGMKGVEASEIRIDTVKKLCAERGISFDDSKISYGDFWSQPTERACKAIIDSGHIPEAVICANDIMAITACGVFRENGIRVPEDVIVTGFDGISEIDFTSPTITSAECDYIKMGHAAAEILLSEDDSPRDIYIMPDVVINGSCGCNRCLKTDGSVKITNLENSFHRFRNEERKLDAIGSKVQCCENLDEVEEILQDRVFYEMACILKKECADMSVDPLRQQTDTPFGEDMIVLFDTSEPYIGKDRSLDIKEVIPHLENKLREKMPLIFSALHLIDIPLGYTCFYYKNPNIEEYYKVGQSTDALSTAIGGYRNMRYQNRLRERIEEIYKYDDLTGLYTRNGFHRELDRIMDEGSYDVMTLVLCDLDGLKYINDNFSHTEGDNAIKIVSEALRSACGDGICSKHGGDELVSILTHKCDENKIKAEIERYLSEYNETSGKPYIVSASVGIYTAETHGESFSKMFAEADKRMYKEKSLRKSTRIQACY